jgi:hypothetical protein
MRVRVEVVLCDRARLPGQVRCLLSDVSSVFVFINSVRLDWAPKPHVSIYT